jgi:hypothetical protein
MGLSFTVSAGPRQHSHSQVRVPRYLWSCFTVSDSKLPNLEGQASVCISPRNRVAQLYPQALGSLFFASDNAQDYGGNIRTRLQTVHRDLISRSLNRLSYPESVWSNPTVASQTHISQLAVSFQPEHATCFLHIQTPCGKWPVASARVNYRHCREHRTARLQMAAAWGDRNLLTLQIHCLIYSSPLFLALLCGFFFFFPSFSLSLSSPIFLYPFFLFPLLFFSALH